VGGLNLFSPNARLSSNNCIVFAHKMCLSHMSVFIELHPGTDSFLDFQKSFGSGSGLILEL